MLRPPPTAPLAPYTTLFRSAPASAPEKAPPLIDISTVTLTDSAIESPSVYGTVTRPVAMLAELRTGVATATTGWPTAGLQPPLYLVGTTPLPTTKPPFVVN